jgi:hypothetical protein
MAIIYTYPTKASPAADDLILISDSADGNKTKQIKVSALPSSGAGITLTTTGTSGPAELNGTVLNIPNYATTGGTPDGPDHSVQYKNGSAFAGSNDLIFHPTNNIFSVKHTVIVKGQGNGNPAGKLKLNCEQDSHAITLEGPAHSGGADYTLKFPSAAPGNTQILQSNNAGQLSWINTPSGGGAVDSVNTTDGTYINLTPNSATTGAVTVTADLSAVDGTSDTTTKFLSKDNTWDVPTYTTDTTYNVMGSGNNYDAGLVLAGNATHNDEFLRKDGTWQATASYTEGTWTPSLTFGGGQTAPTLTVASGNYVIIGKYVYANFYVVTQAGTQYTGTLPRISIPVAAASHNGGHLMMNNAYTTTSTNTSVILGSVVGGMSIVGLKTMDVSGSEVRIQNLGTSPSTSYNNAVLTGSIIYLKS